eukprot:390483-Karenia_brevis.AAC.1
MFEFYCKSLEVKVCRPIRSQPDTKANSDQRSGQVPCGEDMRKRFDHCAQRKTIVLSMQNGCHSECILSAANWDAACARGHLINSLPGRSGPLF